MQGPIKRFAKAMHLTPPKKGRKGKKRPKRTGSVYRDYRGTRGAVEDASGK